MTIQWWKLLAILLMLYVICAGFLIPLRPGILDSTNNEVRTGEAFETGVRCYNSFLTRADDLRVWLWMPDDRLLAADRVEVLNDTYLKAYFEALPADVLPAGSGGQMASLMIDNRLEGHYFLRNAVQLKPGQSETATSGTYASLDEVYTVRRLAFPFQPILYETTRNTYFHVAIWMAMFALLITSCYYSIMYLVRKNIAYDTKAASLTTVAIVFGLAGLLTGSMWAKYTWGAFWTDDVKLNMTAVSLLIYLAYWVLRGSLTDPDARARLASVFNLFAFASLMVLVMVIPRLTDSLHPGNGGNPAFSSYDMDNTMRMVFYPAIIAYFLIGLWMAELQFRYRNLKRGIMSA